ncbi:MAG: rod shape-determining protein RodA [Candidatus Cloacimonetes bacterium]|nr:rod shape-determining protein RodA [Candidatus Cloacimonadota bacterium]
MKNFNWSALVLLIILLLVGVFSIYTASTTKIGDEITTENFYIRQIFWIFISLIMLYIIVRIPRQVLDVLIVPGYVLTVLMLVLVLFLPQIKGSHRWIGMGFANFQPSELAKLVTILLTAKLLSRPHQSDWQMIYSSLLVVTIPALLILIEPDLGTSLTLFVSLFAILMAGPLPKFYIVIFLSPLISIVASFSLPIFLVLLALLLWYLYNQRLGWVTMMFIGVFNTFVALISPVIWHGLKEYQQNRILTFIDPMRDPFGAGYQIIQSKIAIGSGGLWGKGFLMGTQKNLKFLPEHHTDFIFSVIGEEFGFFGCLIVLTLFFLFLFSLVRSIRKLKRNETYFASIGIVTYLAFQIFVNVGMNLGVVPTTGIPLPFISYGGSNLLINVMAVGFVLKLINERSIFG